MTLKEIKLIKKNIHIHKKILLTKDLDVENILEALEVLINLKANQGLIDTWMQSVQKEWSRLIKALEEIKE